MTIHSTGPEGLTMYIDKEELDSLGFAGDLDKNAAVGLAESAFESLGLHDRGGIELEAFSGKGGVLVFARIKRKEKKDFAFFTFQSCDELLDAVPLLQQSGVSFKAYPGNILYISACRSTLTPLLWMLGEYGRRLYRPRTFAGHLEEHGA